MQRPAAFPGAVLAVERDGQLPTLRAVGWQNRATDTQMTEDSLFRLYSMTKSIVSVASMHLIEDRRLLLAAQVSAYLPDFARLEVGREITGADSKPAVETHARHAKDDGE